MKSALKAVIAVFTTDTEQCILFKHLDSLNDNPSPFLCPNESPFLCPNDIKSYHNSPRVVKPNILYT